MESINTEKFESMADELIEDIEDVGYPENWDINKAVESTIDNSGDWLLIEIFVDEKESEFESHIQIYAPRSGGSYSVWVTGKSKTKRSEWGLTPNQLVETSKRYIDELREDWKEEQKITFEIEGWKMKEIGVKSYRFTRYLEEKDDLSMDTFTLFILREEDYWEVSYRNPQTSDWSDYKFPSKSQAYLKVRDIITDLNQKVEEDSNLKWLGT